MTRRIISRPRCVLAAATLVSAISVAAASADPIVVTSGLFHIPDDDPSFFRFEGADGFFLAGLFTPSISSPRLSCLRGCAPGTAVNMSAIAGGVSMVTPFSLGLSTGAIVNGREFLPPLGLQPDSAGLVGTLRFDAPAVVLPAFDGTGRGVNVTAPFAFTGEVTGFAHDDVERRAALFDVSLAGAGTATLSLSVLGGLFQEPEVTYTFAATPEPATLALLGTGILPVIAARARRRASG